FTREEERPGRHVPAALLPQAIVEDHDPQRIEELPLVLVDPLDLAVEYRLRIGRLAGGLLQPAREARLLLLLCLANHLAKAAVVRQGLQTRQLGEIGGPTLANRLGDASAE